MGTYDNGGVHYNCGVIEYWFYLLSQGGSGTNDLGNSYSVDGIGINKAAAIIYRTVMNYFTNTANYSDLSFYSKVAAIDLYGPCSPELKSVTDALYAVNLSEPYTGKVISDFVADFPLGCETPFTVHFINKSQNSSTFIWDFGDGNTSTNLNPEHTYTNNGTFTVSLLADGGICGSDTTTKQNFINIAPKNDCPTIMPTNGISKTITKCFGTLYDNGGKQNYSNNLSSIVVIAPNNADNITLTFDEFNFESDYDYLIIYDGPNTESTVIDSFTGSFVPLPITSRGNAITIKQYSDAALTFSGFKLSWSCNISNIAPVANFFASDSITCSGKIQFTDASSHYPTQWLWDFGDGTTSNEKNPFHTFIENNTYSVTLITSNNHGSDTIVKNKFIRNNRPQGPIIEPNGICGSGLVTLQTTSSNSINWYDSRTSTNSIYTGPSYTTYINNTDTFYAEEVIIPPLDSVGKLDITGEGGYFSNSTIHYQVFDCYAPITLVSVEVYAETSGNRTIELRDNNNKLLQSKTVNLTTGKQTVTLNFIIPIGSDYKLVGPAYPNLFRNSGGCNYPYEIPGVISIKYSSATTYRYQYYYYFYNWKIQQQQCISERIPVIAYVNTENPVAASRYSNDPIVSFTNESLRAYSYRWCFDDGTVSNQNNPVHLYAENGKYIISLTAYNACDSNTIYDTLTISNATTIKSIKNTDLNYKIYPNPSNDFVIIKSETTVNTPATIELFDISGRLLLQQHHWFTAQQPKYVLSISTINTGLYLLQIKTNHTNSIVKLIKK